MVDDLGQNLKFTTRGTKIAKEKIYKNFKFVNFVFFVVLNKKYVLGTYYQLTNNSTLIFLTELAAF
jgi:hypothetical protein